MASRYGDSGSTPGEITGLGYIQLHILQARDIHKRSEGLKIHNHERKSLKRRNYEDNDLQNPKAPCLQTLLIPDKTQAIYKNK